MAKITYNICVLIVTYSDRWQFLEQVLKRVASFEGVTDIVVVDNASVYSVEARCGLLGDERIKVISNTSNLGSAGGYKAGLEYFNRATTADFIWLLDDDNQPAIGALEKLTGAWSSTVGAVDKKALFSLRPDRKQHVMVACGEDADRFFAVKNSFMGFNLFRIPVNQYHKLKDRFIKKGTFKDKALIPYAPYGGMFFHRKMLDLIGYPDEKFFVYADDSEYTHRITAMGGQIWLIPASVIIDVDTSYGIRYIKRLWRSVYLDVWSFRTYYQVRNSVYFNDRVNVTNQMVYGLNKCIFMSGQWLISKLSSRAANYERLVTAIEDGLSGRLGIANPEKYS